MRNFVLGGLFFGWGGGGVNFTVLGFRAAKAVEVLVGCGLERFCAFKSEDGSSVAPNRQPQMLNPD